MGSIQFGLENQIGSKKTIIFSTIIFTIENMMK